MFRQLLISFTEMETMVLLKQGGNGGWPVQYRIQLTFLTKPSVMTSETGQNFLEGSGYQSPCVCEIQQCSPIFVLGNLSLEVVSAKEQQQKFTTTIKNLEMGYFYDQMCLSMLDNCP
jgi:hypothetical protein